MSKDRLDYLLRYYELIVKSQDWSNLKKVSNEIEMELELGKEKKEIDEVKECAEVIFSLFESEGERRYFNKLSPNDKLFYIKMLMAPKK